MNILMKFKKAYRRTSMRIEYRMQEKACALNLTPDGPKRKVKDGDITIQLPVKANRMQTWKETGCLFP